MSSRNISLIQHDDGVCLHLLLLLLLLTRLFVIDKDEAEQDDAGTDPIDYTSVL